MDKVEINGELYFIEAPERFAWILEEKLGADAARYFRETIADLKFDPNSGGDAGGFSLYVLIGAGSRARDIGGRLVYVPALAS